VLRRRGASSGEVSLVGESIVWSVAGASRKQMSFVGT
jgi:hypothetical protein